MQPVPAECHSDDYTYEARFDAAEWLQQAAPEEILDLAACSWGGDAPADEVARFYSERNPEVGAMFNYLHRIRATRRACGFECHVEEAPALRWLQTHRPEVYAQLDAAELI